MTVTAWAVTTGEAGMRTQARGLAGAAADVVVEKTVRGGLAWPWAARRGDDSLAPPYPDVMITCGRRAAPFGDACESRHRVRTPDRRSRLPRRAFDDR